MTYMRISLLGLIVLLSSCNSVQSREVVLSGSFPENFEVIEITCSGEFPIIFGHRRKFGSVETEATILVSEGSGRFAEPYSQSRSRILSGTVESRGSAIAIVKDDKESSVILSRNAGYSWGRLPSGPTSLLGAVLDVGGSAYAWSGSSIYFSSAIDSEWTQRQYPQFFQRGRPVPVVDSDGWLWVVQNRQHGPISRIVAFDPELVVRVDQEMTDKIVGIAPSGDGLALALQKGGFGNSIVALANKRNGSIDINQVSDLGEDLIVDFDASSTDFAVIMSRISGKTASRYIVVESRDGGRHRRFSMGRDLPQQICIAPSGTRWVAGGEHLWQLPNSD